MSEKEYETRLPIEGEDAEQDDYEEFEELEEPNVLKLIKWIPYILKHLLWIVGCWIIVAIPIVVLILVGDFEYSEIPKFNAEASGSLGLLAAMFLFWLGLMATLASIISFICDIVPRIILTFTEKLFSGRTETVKHYIEFYTALSATIKLVLTVVSIFFLFKAAFPASSSSFDSTSGVAWLNGIYKAIFCLLILTLLISLEKLLLHLIAKRFHRTAYRHRLDESDYATRVLDSLNKARKEVKLPIEPPSPHFLSQRTFSEESLGDRPNKKESGIYQNINQAVFEGRYEDDVDLHSRTEARKLAHKIFRALQGQRRHLLLEDFYAIFPTPEEARKAFEFFDRDGNGDISKREMSEKIQYVYKERKDITNALRDTSQAVGKLDVILLIIFIVIAVFICCAKLGTDLYTSLLPFGTFFLALSFIFADSAKELFQSIIFLFVMHPYDAGDRVYIAADNLLVMKVGLLGTTFTHINGQVTYIPHSILKQNIIFNIRRSLHQAEQIDFQIDFSTPKEKIVALKERINKYLEAEESREFHGDPLMALTEIVDSNKLKMYFWLEHKGNWQDGGRRWARRTRFMIALREICRELDLSYSLLPLKIQHMNPPPYTEKRS